MFRNQPLIPKLPVPPLQQTIEQYLENVRPLVPPDAFRCTEQLCREFAASEEAQRLHDYVLQQQQDPAVSNWLSRWWSDSYMTDRSTLGILISPSVSFNPVPATIKASPGLPVDQLSRATVILTIVLDMHRQIRQRTLEPDVIKGTTRFCMMDYDNVFSGVRLPCLGRDQFISHASSNTRHIVVMCNGRIFRFDVLTDDAQNFLSMADLYRGLKEIHQAALSSDVASEARNVGLLTALDRDAWATARAALMAHSARNLRALHDIETAICVFTLDAVDGDSTATSGMTSLLHGTTIVNRVCPELPAGDTFNRWYDKSLQVHMTRNGHSGATFEHSAMDSMPGIRLVRMVMQQEPALWDKLRTEVSTTEKVAAIAPVWREVDFALSEESKGHVAKGSKALASILSRLQIRVLYDPDISFQAVRQLATSPDAFAQMAMQVAFRQVRGFVPSVYESATTKSFLWGRTETLRPLTTDSAAFVAAYFDAFAGTPAIANRGNDDAVKRVGLALRKAAATHARMAGLCGSGQGCDRHLLGLMMAAKELNPVGAPLPPIFTDPSYTAYHTITLSTSQPLSGPGIDSLVGFGPVTEKCIGVGYCMLPHAMTATITSWRQEGEPDGQAVDAFDSFMRVAMANMRQALAATLPSPRVAPKAAPKL